LRECANVHHDLFLPLNWIGSFENRGCSLACRVGDNMLPLASINENYPCPKDTTGICRNGLCLSSILDAQTECSTIHNFDFGKFNTTGTSYSRDICSFDCVHEGKVLSRNVRNQGMVCRDGSGICHNGACDGIGPKVTLPTTSTTRVSLTPEHPLTTSYPIVGNESAFYNFSKLESMNGILLDAFAPLAHLNLGHTMAIICLMPGQKSPITTDCHYGIDFSQTCFQGYEQLCTNLYIIQCGFIILLVCY